MGKLSEYAFVASMLATGLALVMYLFYAVSGLRAARMQTAGGPATAPVLMSGPRTAAMGGCATILAWLATLALLASLAFRSIVTGHGPFANMYEFSMAFAFGILICYLYFERKYHQRILALVALPVALGMLLYAATIPADIEPLVPALQNNLLLTVHVATAIVAYGSFAIGFAASYLFLLQTRHAMALVLVTLIGFGATVVGGLTAGTNAAGQALIFGMSAAALSLLALTALDWVQHRGAAAAAEAPDSGRWGLPKPMVLDEIGYRSVVVGFPVPLAHDHPRRRLGRDRVGAVLELGSQGDRVAGDLVHLRCLPPRPRDAWLARQQGILATPDRVPCDAAHLLRQPDLRRPPQLRWTLIRAQD